MKILSSFKEEFNKKINKYLDQKIEWSKKIDDRGAILFKIIKDFVNFGGKRFRPALFYYAYKSYSSKDLDKAFELSFVFELFHSFALIHDDIIDNSKLRRGNMTIHEKYNQAVAILTGDLSLMLADEIFFNHSSGMAEIYSDFKQELIIGQYLDTEMIVDTNKIMELKTARYSFVKPVLFGLKCAGVNDSEIEKWTRLLKETGIIFQLKDDYIGTFSDEKKIGKSVTSDFEEKKNTAIVVLLRKKINKTDLKKLNQVFGNKDYFYWYLKKLKQFNIDVEIQTTIIEKGEKIIKELNLNFKNRLLAGLLEEIIFNILDFS